MTLFRTPEPWTLNPKPLQVIALLPGQFVTAGELHDLVAIYVPQVLRLNWP